MQQTTINYNAIRWGKISALKRKNLKLSGQLLNFSKQLDQDKSKYMVKLSKNLCKCAGVSLFADSAKGTTGITGYLCGDKLCFVCNSQRMRQTRRKYMYWFKNNPYLFYFEKDNGERKYTTITQAAEKHSGKQLKKVFYDVMHFTLTVPHTAETGYKGKQLYYDEITGAMANLRRHNFWKEMILAGEYGIETERKENGPHIHIHGLALVKNETQNRNKFHKELFIAWNNLTVDENKPYQPFSDEVIKLILKSNRLLSVEDIKKIDPRGATFINVESIFSYNDNKKERIINAADPRFIRGIMEAIKYHFEPLFFNKGTKEFDLQMIADIKPYLHGKPLYKKFGAFVGEKSLNINSEIAEEFKEVTEEIDSDTGEIFQREFYLLDASQVWADKEKIHYTKEGLRKRVKLKASTTDHAIQILSNLIERKSKAGQL